MGGSGQATGSVMSDINFSPVIQFGEEQSATQEVTKKQEAQLSPRQEGGGSLGVGVGVGGGSGTASLPTSKADYSNQEVGFSDMPVLDKTALEKWGITPTYLFAGLGAAGLAIYLSKKKKK